MAQQSHIFEGQNFIWQRSSCEKHRKR